MHPVIARTRAQPNSAPPAGRTIEAELPLVQALNCAALLVDGRGLVVTINTLAERLLGSDLRVREGRLEATDRTSHDRLKDLLRSTVTCATLSYQMLPPVALRRGNARPLIAQALRVPGVGGHALALLLLTDLEAAPELSEDRLELLFDLTRAEGRLAIRIATGASLEQVAEMSGVSLGTARNQLKSVFAKTGTRRQAELVALLWRTARMATERTG